MSPGSRCEAYTYSRDGFGTKMKEVSISVRIAVELRNLVRGRRMFVLCCHWIGNRCLFMKVDSIFFVYLAIPPSHPNDMPASTKHTSGLVHDYVLSHEQSKSLQQLWFTPRLMIRGRVHQTNSCTMETDSEKVADVCRYVPHKLRYAINYRSLLSII